MEELEQEMLREQESGNYEAEKKEIEQEQE
jgi:hypothetical protein